MRQEKLRNEFRRVERARGRPDDRLGQVLLAARPGVPAVVDLVEDHFSGRRTRRGIKPVNDGAVPYVG